MPIAPFLALNSRAAATPRLRRFVNATPTNIGATFGTNDTDGTGSLDRARGYPAVVKFGGSKTFLATVGNAVYRSTDGGASWTSVKSLAGFIYSTTTIAKSGLFVLHVAGVATAVMVTQSGSSTYYAHTSTDGVAWTTLGPFSLPGFNYYIPNDSVVFAGKLVTIWSEDSQNASPVTIFDPVAGTMVIADIGSLGGANYGTASSLCVFNNRLFALVRTFGGSGATALKEFIAGTWVSVSTGLSTGGSQSIQKTCLFVDGASMYGFLLKGTGVNAAGWNVYKWDSSLTRTEVTASVIPTALASGLGGDQRMSVIVDNRTTPGAAPIFWLLQSVDGAAASAMNLWQWNGGSSFIGTLPGSSGSGSNDSGGTARDNLPFIKHAQGSTFWTSGEDHVEMKGLSPVLGGLSVAFVMYSDASTGTGQIRAWQGTGDDEYPLTAANLTGAGATTFPKDNATVNTVTWNAQSDGFATGILAKFILEKF